MIVNSLPTMMAAVNGQAAFRTETLVPRTDTNPQPEIQNPPCRRFPRC